MAQGMIFDSKCDDIYQAIGMTDFIVVSGLPSVGKTTMVNYILNDHSAEFVYSYINCNTIAKSTQLYSSIVQNFADNIPKKLKLIQKSITGVRDFVDIVENLIDQAEEHKLKIIVALDSIEFIKRTAAMDCLTVLATIRKLKLIIITCETASSVIENYFKSYSVKASLEVRLECIYIKPWTKEDIIEEICKTKPHKLPELYRRFVNNVVQIFYQNGTRNFIELRTFCHLNFGNFLKQYENEYKKIVSEKEPDFKDKSLEFIKENLELTASDERRIVTAFLESFKNMIKNKDYHAVNNHNVDRKVVIGTSLLIIATFIAANTKPSDDKINFVKLQKKKIKKDRFKGDRKQDDDLNYLRRFTMERLIQIYRGLNYITNRQFDDGNSETIHIPDSVLSDIKMLEDLKIIKIVSGDGFDTGTTYQLSRDLERKYVERLAKQTEINLEDFSGL